MTSIKMALAIVVMAAVLCAGAHAVPRHRNKAPTRPRNQVAVVRSKYDDVEATLRYYRIPHDLLFYRDLENPERVAAYRSLFVPSGVDNLLEEGLDVYANNFRFKSVTLKPDFYEVDRDKVALTVRRFIKNGGSAYFSGYSFDYLQRAFNMFEYFENFPYMGLSSHVEADVRNDLSRFSLKRRMGLVYDHPGWIGLRSVRNAEVIASGSFDTARGIRSGPLAFLARRGSGEMLYTSYDSSAPGEFRRFGIYRIAGARLMEDLEDMAAKWGQGVTGRIINAVHGGEYAATHRLDLAAGTNYIYFHSDREYFQIDLLDRGLSLIESRDIFDRDQTFVVDSGREDHCYIRLYPSTNDRFGIYAVVSASGRRTVPYRYHFLAALGVIAAAGAGYFMYRHFVSTGYRGRWRG
ncbi:MAG TPA: hypothetical protein PLA65_03540 [Spirochaetota bacterium]|nr:hypothetical protein [Spirochaetota bacterium]HPN11106.1 hypothetical protein [Spirochaetota bacterium]